MVSMVTHLLAAPELLIIPFSSKTILIVELVMNFIGSAERVPRLTLFCKVAKSLPPTLHAKVSFVGTDEPLLLTLSHILFERNHNEVSEEVTICAPG